MLGDRPFGLPRPPKDDERTFVDRHGTEWLVYERVVHMPIGGPRLCLIFESTFIGRRVCSFPSNWRELKPGALERLSWTP